MISIALAVSAAAISFSVVLNLWRLLVGPTPTDRLLALDTMVINSIALIILFGMSYATFIYFEAALLFAMVAFVATISFCKYLLRGNVIE
jgi:multicomponent K+:H+ antiporter subunit F